MHSSKQIQRLGKHMKKRSAILAAMLAAATLVSAAPSAYAGGNFGWSHHGGHNGNYGHHNGNGYGHHNNDNYGNGHYTPKPFRICFYSRTHYRGHRFCESNFRSKNKVSHKWRHKIKSVKIHRNGHQGHHSPSIRLCNDYRGHGYCKTFYKGSPRLNERLYRHVYSYNISQ